MCYSRRLLCFHLCYQIQEPLEYLIRSSVYFFSWYCIVFCKTPSVGYDHLMSTYFVDWEEYLQLFFKWLLKRKLKSELPTLYCTNCFYYLFIVKSVTFDVFYYLYVVKLLRWRITVISRMRLNSLYRIR